MNGPADNAHMAKPPNNRAVFGRANAFKRKGFRGYYSVNYRIMINACGLRRTLYARLRGFDVNARQTLAFVNVTLGAAA